MRTALKLYGVYGILTFFYSLANDSSRIRSTETIRHKRHLYISLLLNKMILYVYAERWVQQWNFRTYTASLRFFAASQNDSLRIRVKMSTALKLYDIYGIFTLLYSLAKRFFTDKRKDAYSTETLRYIRHLNVFLQLSKTILYGLRTDASSLRFFKMDMYSTETLRHIRQHALRFFLHTRKDAFTKRFFYVSLQLNKTILYGYA